MPRKRKSNFTSGGGGDYKRTKSERSLHDFPMEILNMILSYVLPDPTDPRWSVDRLGTAKLFTHPILQTSHAIRQHCLALIHGTCVWVRLKLHNVEIVRDFGSEVLELPTVPAKFMYLIPDDAAMVHLTTEGPFGTRRRNTRSFNDGMKITYLPYNFDSLTRIFYWLSDLADEFDVTELLVEYLNLTTGRQLRTRDLTVHALSTVRYVEKIKWKVNGMDYRPKRPGKDLSMGPPVTLVQLFGIATDILRRVNELRDAGYSDEAGLLLLHSGWVMTESDPILPVPHEWALGEEDEEPPSLMGWVWNGPTGGRSQKGNKLRSMLHRIEYGARLAYVGFAKRYDRRWCQMHDMAFGTPEDRFLTDPEHGWFGLRVSELSELHYSRALFQEVLGRVAINKAHLQADPESVKRKSYKRRRDEMDVIELENLESAAFDMYFARMLAINDGDILAIYQDWIKLLGSRGTRHMEYNAIDNFTIVPHQPDALQGTDLTRPRIQWAGDIAMLEDWGGQNILQFLPLAQKGLEPSQTFEEWGHEYFRRGSGNLLPGVEDDNDE